MLDDLKSYVLQSHNWFFPVGAAITSPAAGVVSQTNWPDSDEPTLDDRFVGDTEDWSAKKNVESNEVKKAVAGALVRKQIVDLFQSCDFEFTINSLRRLAFQLMFGASVDLTPSVGAFTPMSRFSPEGLWISRKYTNEGDTVFLMNCWCKVDVQELGGGQQAVLKPKFTVKLLDAADNYMFFGDPSLLA